MAQNNSLDHAHHYKLIYSILSKQAFMRSEKYLLDVSESTNIYSNSYNIHTMHTGGKCSELHLYFIIKDSPLKFCEILITDYGY